MTEGGAPVMDLLASAQAGDTAAGQALVEALYPMVIRIAQNHRPIRMTEQDLAQEVFLKLFARLDRYEARQGVPFEHWVSRLAVRTCLDCLRSERRRPEVRQSDLPEEEQDWLEYLLVEQAPAPESSDFAAVEMLERLLATLAPEDRLVLRLLDLEQKSTVEISALTGWSRPAVKVRAFRARRRLRKAAENFREVSIA